MYVEPHVVSEAVRHEQAGDTLGDHIVRTALDESERLQAVEHPGRNGKVHVTVSDPGPYEAIGIFVTLVNYGIHIPLA